MQPDDLVAMLHGVLHKLPPTLESHVQAQAILVEHISHIERVAEAYDTKRSRLRLLDDAHLQLIKQLEELSNTEHPDQAEQLEQTRQAEQLTTKESNRE